MWDNLRKLAKATHSPPHSGETSVLNVHPVLNLYEVLSFLLVIPGLFTTYGIGVLFIILNTAAARCISKGQVILPLIIIFISNTIVAFITLSASFSKDDTVYSSFALSIPLLLFSTGIAAVYFESTRKRLS